MPALYTASPPPPLQFRISFQSQFVAAESKSTSQMWVGGWGGGGRGRKGVGWSI